MIWVLAVLALVILLLLIPVRVGVFLKSGGTPEVVVYWLFLRYRVYPHREKPKTPGKAAGRKPKEPRKPKAKPAPAPEDFTRQMGLLVDLAAAAKGAAGFLLRRLRLRVKLDMTVAKGDAARTAIAYGRTNAAVYGIYAAAENFLRLDRPDLSIRPDFTAEKGNAALEVRGGLSPMAVIGSALLGGGRFLVRTVRRSRRNKSEK